MNATLRAFIRKELVQTLRHPRMRVLLFVAPIVQLTLLGYAISTEVRNIPLQVYAAPDDRIALRLAERCVAAGLFLPANAAGVR